MKPGWLLLTHSTSDSSILFSPFLMHTLDISAITCRRSCADCLCQTPSYICLATVACFCYLFPVPISPRAKLHEELDDKGAESSESSPWSKEGHGHMYWSIMHSLATFLLAVLYTNFQIELDTSAVVFSVEW